ncbi:MAG: glycosyltransferase family 4 protein [Crocinitomicaceae bacterium]|nr:glycosyltransferase family 4 protein [Crocinitomicaceae bacterium]
MKIVFVCQVFSEKMGYITNCLPKALAKRGHEVHVIAPNLQAYFNDPDYESTYREFLGPPVTELREKVIDGFILHRLPHAMYKTEPYYKKGLHKKLREIKPDVVQVFHVDSIICWQVCLSKIILGFKMYGANHVLRSVFPLEKNWNKLSLLNRFGWSVKHKIGGGFLGLFVKKYFYATKDAEEIATRWFGASRKKSIIEPFGVDIDIFKPDHLSKNRLKVEAGFHASDKICIYTGRFSEGKSPILLAKAVDYLAEEHPHIKALFIGNGIQEDEIRSMKNCFIKNFVQMTDLPRYYQLADVGVWPRQESISMLDAMASGLPLIINHTVTVIERVEGNGLLYELDDYYDLSKKILQIFSSDDDYLKMSTCGINKIYNQYSWEKVAVEREMEYGS